MRVTHGFGKLVLHGRIPMLNKLTSSFISRQKIKNPYRKFFFFGELPAETYVTRDTEISKNIKKLISLKQKKWLCHFVDQYFSKQNEATKLARTRNVCGYQFYQDSTYVHQESKRTVSFLI